MATGSILSTFPGANILRQTPDTLRSLLANATPEDLDWQPAPDRWSISMVLAHLADVGCAQEASSAKRAPQSSSGTKPCEYGNVKVR